MLRMSTTRAMQNRRAGRRDGNAARKPDGVRLEVYFSTFGFASATGLPLFGADGLGISGPFGPSLCVPVWVIGFLVRLVPRTGHRAIRLAAAVVSAGRTIFLPGGLYNVVVSAADAFVYAPKWSVGLASLCAAPSVSLSRALCSTGGAVPRPRPTVKDCAAGMACTRSYDV